MNELQILVSDKSYLAPLQVPVFYFQVNTIQQLFLSGNFLIPENEVEISWKLSLDWRSAVVGFNTKSSDFLSISTMWK